MTTTRMYDSARLQFVDTEDEGIIAYMLDVFVRLIPPAAEDMRKAYEAQDLDRVRALARRIKPSIFELDIQPLKDTIVNIEAEASAGQKTPSLGAQIEKLCGVIMEVKGQMLEEIAARK